MSFSDQEKAYFVRILIEEGYSFVEFQQRIRKEHGSILEAIEACIGEISGPYAESYERYRRIYQGQ
jgi:hypothetical protein